MLASRKSKAGQRDHRIAAPVAEPVVAGNDGFLFPARHDVLVGRRDETPYEAIFKRRCHFSGLATRDLCLPILSNLEDIVLACGGNHRALTAIAQVKTQYKRIEQVFAEVEAAFP